MGTSHVIDVHQFRILLVITAEDDVGQGFGRIQGSEAGNIHLQGFPMQGNIVLQGAVQQCAGIDDVIDLATFQQIKGMVALPDAGDDIDWNAQCTDGFRRARRGIQDAPQIVELAGNIDSPQGNHIRPRR